jgi:hypothetical protein
MLVMSHVHTQKLEPEQEDTSQNLSATVELQSPDPFLSIFKVVNGGKTGLVHHKIWCSINHALIGMSHLSHVSAGYDTGLSDVLIHPGEDSEIKACLAIAPGMGVLSCADVSLFYHYSLESQPDIDSKKEFRFIGRFWGGKDFHWSSLTLNAPLNVKCNKKGPTGIGPRKR